MVSGILTPEVSGVHTFVAAAPPDSKCAWTVKRWITATSADDRRYGLPDAAVTADR